MNDGILPLPGYCNENTGQSSAPNRAYYEKHQQDIA